MRRFCVSLLLSAVAASGCGPSAHELHEKTLSVLNAETDRWDGSKQFATSAVDAYGRPLTCTVEKTTFDYVLEMRSSGPDGLPKNSDDLVVTRRKPHGETTLTQEASRAVEALSGAAASGVIKGIKKEVGLGGKKDRKQ